MFGQTTQGNEDMKIKWYMVPILAVATLVVAIQTVPARIARKWKVWRLNRQAGEWEYGTAGLPPYRARRHRKTGDVQFVLWEAGQQGHTEDYWINFSSFWYHTFKPDKQEQHL